MCIIILVNVHLCFVYGVSVYGSYSLKTIFKKNQCNKIMPAHRNLLYHCIVINQRYNLYFLDCLRYLSIMGTFRDGKAIYGVYNYISIHPCIQG